MKRASVKMDPKSADLAVKLRQRLERDEKRFKNLRCVYLYRNCETNTYTDNVIMLDYATRQVHEEFLKLNFSNFVLDLIRERGKEAVKNEPSLYVFHNHDIHFVGVFDKLYLKFTPNKKCKKILDCDSILSAVLEVEK